MFKKRVESHFVSFRFPLNAFSLPPFLCFFFFFSLLLLLQNSKTPQKQHGRTSTARLLKEKGIIIFKVSSRSRESSYRPLTRRRSFSRREKIFYSTDAHPKGEASCLLRRLSSSRGGGRTAAYNRSRFFFSLLKRAHERVLLEREREQRRTANVTTTTTTTRSSHQKRREQNGQRNERERDRDGEKINRLFFVEKK